MHLHQRSGLSNEMEFLVASRFIASSFISWPLVSLFISCETRWMNDDTINQVATWFPSRWSKHYCTVKRQRVLCRGARPEEVPRLSFMIGPRAARCAGRNEQSVMNERRGTSSGRAPLHPIQSILTEHYNWVCIF
jgi:hypothetical protein